MLAFADTGVAWAQNRFFDQIRGTSAGGVGFRYLIARRHGLHSGIDLAWGEDGPAFYLQFGSDWFRP
ncbi:MAG: hypothetical protein ACQKBU_08155 [Verrucomicrobiales bacterium]